MIPYGRQTIEEDDVQAVVAALRSDLITQGPLVTEFEKALAGYAGAAHAVVFSNGTAALQAAYFAAGVKPGDEIVSTPLTFAATTNAALWMGAKIVFADVDPRTGNLDPAAAEKSISPQTKILVPVDFAGQPVDLDAFRALAKSKKLALIEDACHSLGASYKQKKIGGVSDMTIFSFHPVKSMTTGEGGAVLTNNAEYAERLARFRSHGIRREADWEYAVEDLGQNYRLTDFQCALGLSQLKKLDRFLARRRQLADRYARAFSGWEEAEPLAVDSGVESSWHLYVLKLKGKAAALRREIFRALRKRDIWVQVHYIPVYWHPLYQRMGYAKGLCPKAEGLYESILSLPMYPTLTDAQQDQVISTLRNVFDELYESGVRR